MVLGGLEGRFDHTAGVINSLLRVADTHVAFIRSKESVVCVLPPGEHRLVINTNIEGPTCGVIPLNGPARVRTEGLKWNLGLFNLGGVFVRF